MDTRLARCSFLIPSLLLLVSAVLAAQGETKPTKGTAKAADGLSIAYDVRGKGDTALVFLHGWCSDRESWKHQLDEFAADYRVVAIDLAGHGESGKNRKQWSVSGLGEDVAGVLKELGLRRAILVGHSMGGPVSLEVAKRMPSVVVGVIGVDTLQNAEFKWPEEVSKQFLAAFETDFKGTLRMGIRGMLPERVDPELLKWITSKVEAQDERMAIGLMRDMAGMDTKAILKDVKVPVRCINAAGGFQFHIPTAIDVNRKYADYHAVMMEGVGHFPMLEKPAEFNGKLRVMLREFAANR